MQRPHVPGVHVNKVPHGIQNNFEFEKIIALWNSLCIIACRHLHETHRCLLNDAFSFGFGSVEAAFQSERPRRYKLCEKT